MGKFKRIVIVGVALIIAIPSFFSLFSPQNASSLAKAKPDRQDILDKAFLAGLAKCYGQGMLKQPLQINDVTGKSSLYNENGDNENFVLLPSEFTLIKDHGISCEELIAGYGSDMAIGGSVVDIFTYFDKTVPLAGTVDEKKSFLENMGYADLGGGGSSGGKKCLNWSYSYEGDVGDTVHPISVCASVDGNGNITDVQAEEDQDPFWMHVENGVLKIEGRSTVAYSYAADTKEFSFQNQTWTNFAEDLESVIRSNYSRITATSNYSLVGTLVFVLNEDSILITDDAPSAEGYGYSDPTAAARTAASWLADGKYDQSGIGLTNEEKGILYQYYVRTFYGADVQCNVANEATKTRLTNEGYKLVRMADSSGRVADCYVKGPKLHTGGGDEDKATSADFSRRLSFDEVLAELSTLPDEALSLTEDNMQLVSSGNPNTFVDKNGDIVTMACNTGAGVFSWIVCPLINWLLDVVNWAYAQVQSQLVVATDFYADESETQRAWGLFRDFANIILVILFISIIISQMTGVGIDNYGIKKMLPRLIVIAILVNLSFILCQLIVDASNVVGSNLFKFLASLGGDMGHTGAKSEEMMALVFGAIITAIIVVIINPIVLLSFGLSLLSALIGVFFLFLLLGVRQAAVALFIVVAPVAFVANILPNTKGLFTKWGNIFKTLLMLFPICGLVMGGGTFAAKLMFAIGGGSLTPGGVSLAENEPVPGGFIFQLVGLVLMFAPIFFIPKLVKGAFEGLGKIGGAVAGLGGKFSGAVTGKITGSGAVNRLKARGASISPVRGWLARRGIGTISHRAAVNARNTQRQQFSTAMRMSRPENIQAEKVQLEAQQFEADINMLQTNITNDMITGKIDFEGLKKKFNESTDVTERTAIARTMASQGKPGVDAMANMLSTAEFASTEDRQRFNQSMQASKNFSDIKKWSPDVADYLSDGEGRSLAHHSGQVGLSPTDITGIDKSTLDRLTAANNGSLTAKNIGLALDSEAGSGIKEPVRSALESLAGRTGDGGIPQAESETQGVLINTNASVNRDNIAEQAASRAAEQNTVLNVQNPPASSPAPTGVGKAEGASQGMPVNTNASANRDNIAGTAASRAETVNVRSGNIRGDMRGQNGGRIITDGPDAGKEQTDSGIII